jgi:malonyl-CoA/methylmalonyl-CoA synthetase
VTSPELISWIKPRLANYKVPKQLVIVAQLPRNALGKVQKNILRETFETLVAAT